jgi:transposase
MGNGSSSGLEHPQAFEEIQNKFRWRVQQSSLTDLSSGDLRHQFGEFYNFYVSTDPDPEDFDDFFEKTDFEPIPELYLPTDSEYSDDEITDYRENPEVPRSHKDTLASRTMPATSTSTSESKSVMACESDMRDGKLREPPTALLAKPALNDLRDLLHPKRKKGHGHIDPELNYFVRIRLEGMQSMLNFYTNPQSTTYEKWGASSYQAAISLGRGRLCARQLCILVRHFVKDHKVLPINPYGQWNESLLVDEDLSNEINIYLQSIGPEISGQKLMDFINNDTALRSQHGIEKKICIKTAQRYLNALGYRYRTPLKGQYADGHEREDVVYYRDQVFLPQWRRISDRMLNWAEGDLPEFGPAVSGRRVITWFHDESVFYAHDRRKKSWYHKDAAAKPYSKGDGHSLMVADFVSADFGWILSHDGKQSARRILKPGASRDGYFTNDDILDQVEDAMRIVKECWPEYDHVFIYDNASTHLKRADDALSARRMPKGTSKPGTNWGVEATKHDPATGRIIYKDGKPEKVKIRMQDAQFADGTPQPLYFPEGHERAGVFKGMAVILEERGFKDARNLRAECKNFKCAPNAQTCCCRRLLYNQPDFANVETILESTCRARGCDVFFLPKFHCELNFIEQCWGYAKRIYRLNPPSSREDQLEKNTLAALEAVPLKSMRKFSNRSRRFMDAYERGLNGRQAAWAARKYRGHRVLPEGIMEELGKKGIA